MLWTHTAAALAGAAIAFGGAYQLQEWRYGAIEAKRLSAAVEAEKARDKASYDAATTFEKGRNRVETVYQTITETVEVIVDRPVYRDTVCFDPDGLQQLARSIGETTAPSPGGAVPATR